MLNSFLQAVLRFQTDILGVTVPSTPTPLTRERGLARIEHLQEEIAELKDALTVDNKNPGDLEEQADAFVDIIYIALGGLIEMGITPGAVFNEVHRANMDKVSGEVSKRPSNFGYDAIKPEGWTGPDIARAMLDMTPDKIKNISPVHLEIAELRAKKGQDYNSTVKLRDYFPMGHASYFQMMHLKTKRAESLIEVIQQGGKPNFEGLRDTLLDALNYITFWVEALDDGDV